MMHTHAITRTNAQWLDGLQRPEPISDAVADLRDFLKRGLARTFADRRDVDDSDLDDFAQDAVLRVLNRIDSFRGDSRFTTWALAVGIRVAMTAMRKRRWGDRSLDDLCIPQDASSDAMRAAPDPVVVTARQDALTALRASIDNDLTPKQRAVVLGELAGMPTAQLAEQLHTNANALYKLHHDARLRLRAGLQQRGFCESDVRDIVYGSSND